ncbi:hypothetical protein OsccyDRAFT_4076 [Leptolyngbyaceae cyanobacterium JSC-12]|nr:hypothetical protein OsccyDRAFT_4076 [Leptolyngbyaceae cyanobacterium JSC-12]
MALSQSPSLRNAYGLLMVKSFLIWMFTLAVCLLVVGFPLVILMVTVGSLLAVILQAVIPMSSVLLVAGGIIGLNILAVILGAAMLTFKGVHPDQVHWLRWLQGEEDPSNTSVYASCPLTCAIRE